jgi:hypothetical protein
MTPEQKIMFKTVENFAIKFQRMARKFLQKIREKNFLKNVNYLIFDYHRPQDIYKMQMILNRD